jgi:hypothetical protein
MAKHCTVCDQDYADDLATCPHCAAAKKTQLAGRNEDRTTQLADSSVDYGTTPPTEAGGEPISGSSGIPWSALVEEPAEEHVKIDSPSDADLLSQAAAAPHEDLVGDLPPIEPIAPIEPAMDEEMVELAESPPKANRMTSDSEVDLGASPVELVEEGSGAVLHEKPLGESDAIVAELASDALHVEAVSDSGTQLVQEANQEAVLDALEASAESSLVDLGGKAKGSSQSLAGEEVGGMAEIADGSGIDLEGLPTPTPSHADLHPSSESAVDLGSHAEIPTELGGEISELKVGSGIDVGDSHEPAAVDPISDLALESMMSESALGETNEVKSGEAEIAEGEEAVAEAEEEEEKPAKPVKQRSRVPALVGGTFLGILIGAGGLIGARVGGVDVPAMMGLGEKEKAPVARPNVTPQPTITFDSMKAMVQNGDWEGAGKAGIENAPANQADQLATRGEYRLAAYLQKVGNKINPQDPALQSALQDLQKAAEQNDASAIYDLAWIKELAGQLPQARADYAKGSQTFQNDPVKKLMFDAAIQRVDLKASGKPAGAAQLWLPEGDKERAILLSLLLIGLQQPGQPAPQPGQPAAAPGQEDNKEAGFDFWQAAKLAREGKYADAIRMLDRARSQHDQRRFTRLRKAQNPLSDPAEDIFLRCCDELKLFWRLEERLRGEGYLTEKTTPEEAFQKLVSLAQTNAALVKDTNDQLLAAKLIAPGDDLTKGIGRLIDEKKKADAKAEDLAGKLTTSQAENKKLSEELTVTKKKLSSVETDLASAKDQITKLKTANGELDAAFKKIATELADAKFLDPKGKPNIAEAVKKAVDVAKIKDPQGMLRQQRMELERLAASLKERWKPEEMLPLWLLLLDENRTRTDLAHQAGKDVDRVTADKSVSKARKGEAAVVLGLALRNTDKFAEAKKMLEAARSSIDKGEWLVHAEAALKEVSDPAAYFGKQAQTLYDRGRMDEALAVLARALTVVPADAQNKVLAKRSLIELDAALSKAKGKPSPADPLLAAARKDAAEAVKAGLAEGHFAAGRIAEEMGQINVAITSYRAALAAHPALDADGASFRMALARALLLPHDEKAAQPPSGAKVSWHDPAPYPSRHFEDMRRLVLMLTLGLQAPLPGGEDAGAEEAERLADEVLKAAPGTVPFNVLSQALAVKGRWNAALQTYVEGIRPMLPREYGNGLMYLVLNHPRLRRPDSLRIPNPQEAEHHFDEGLNFYFDREYGKAEKSFTLAIENDGRDARYFYYLGLSKLCQNRRRDAQDDFDQGALLEHLNRPAPAAVSESLERVQGPMRRILNDYRERPDR